MSLKKRMDQVKPRKVREIVKSFSFKRCTECRKSNNNLLHEFSPVTISINGSASELVHDTFSNHALDFARDQILLSTAVVHVKGVHDSLNRCRVFRVAVQICLKGIFVKVQNFFLNSFHSAVSISLAFLC